MTTNIAHKIRLDPTKEQAIAFSKACGCRRFAYNWGLNEWNNMYAAYKEDKSLPKPSAYTIRKKFNSIKEKEFPWIYESPKDANQNAFLDLGDAFNRFFKGQNEYPQFKSKNKSKDSFYIASDRIFVENYTVKLSVIGNVKMTENLKFNGKIMSATISRQADQWFISFSVELPEYKKEKNVKNDIIGIDLGLNTFAACSDKSNYHAPKPLKKYEKKLKRLQRQHARKQRKLNEKGIKTNSNNREKARIKLARLHKRIADTRLDFLHKLSTKICSENQTIVLEDLKVQNMLKNHKVAKSISDVGWGEFNRQIQYKSKFYDNTLIYADTFYPSSKTCSHCGSIHKKLKLSDRTFKCPICKEEIDRDYNAALNLYRLGYNQIYACGQITSGNILSELDETRNNEK